MKALINHKIAKEFFRTTGVETVELLPYDRLDAPVSAHADMLFCVLDNTVFCYFDYVEKYGLLDILKSNISNIVFVEKTCERKYPFDVSLNVLVMGKKLFANTKHVAKEILDFAYSNGYSVVDVKQGYAACSVLVLDEKNCITSDCGLASVLRQNGINVLLADNTGIELNGYNVGFFGGASAIIGKNVYFFGDASSLRESEKVFEFIKSCGFEVFSILSDRVYDFGGVKLI